MAFGGICPYTYDCLESLTITQGIHPRTDDALHIFLRHSRPKLFKGLSPYSVVQRLGGGKLRNLRRCLHRPQHQHIFLYIYKLSTFSECLLQFQIS